MVVLAFCPICLTLVKTWTVFGDLVLTLYSIQLCGYFVAFWLVNIHSHCCFVIRTKEVCIPFSLSVDFYSLSLSQELWLPRPTLKSSSSYTYTTLLFMLWKHGFDHYGSSSSPMHESCDDSLCSPILGNLVFHCAIGLLYQKTQKKTFF